MTLVELMSTLRLLGKEMVQEVNSPAQTPDTRPFIYRSYNVTEELSELNVAPVDLSTGPGFIDLLNAPLARDKALTIDLSGAVLHSMLCYADPGNVDDMSVQPAWYGTGSPPAGEYPFPSFTLRPGQRIALLSGDLANEQEVDFDHSLIEVDGEATDVVHIIAYFAVPGTASTPSYDSPTVPEDFTMKILRTPRYLSVLTPLVGDIATATEIDLSNYSSLSVMYMDAPGVVTVYGIIKDGDSYGIAQDQDGVNITFTPLAGQPRMVNDGVFGYHKLKLIAGTTERTGSALLKA